MNESDWLRLTRYVTGEGTEEERRETERWVAAAPDRTELVRRLRLGWEHAIQPAEPVDVERAWDEVARRKAVRSTAGLVRPSGGRRAQRPLFDGSSLASQRRRWPLAIAASLAVALAGGAIWRAMPAGPDRGAIAAGPMRTVATGRGQTAEVYLSDGTHVRLGAASTLRFPTTFGRKRDVYLDGEGYFDVVHDARRGFAVHTAEAVVRDIGTQFNVRAYPGGSSTEVVVTEGMASVMPAGARLPSRGAADSAMLGPADFARVDTAGALTVARRVNVDNYLAWMRGQLVFADTPLRDVLPQLNRWYRAEFVLGDSTLADVRLTAVLNVEPLPDVLRRLSALLDARIERQGQVVVFRAKHRER